MQIGFCGGSAQHPVSDGWPQSPGTLTTGESRSAWKLGLDDYRYAHELGFDFLTVFEHHYSASMAPSPAIVAAALSPRLRRAHLVLGVNVLLHNPVRLAEELAQLDVLTDGPLSVALLCDTPHEAATYFDGPAAERRGRFREAVQLLKACWDEPEPFAWEGRHYRYRTVAVWPRTTTGAGPRLLIEGSDQEAVALAVRHGADILLSHTDVADTAERVRMYRRAAAAVADRPDGAAKVLYRNVCYVAGTDEEASSDVGRWASRGGVGAVPRLLCGSPATVIERLRDVHDAGVDQVDLTFNGLGLPHALVRNSLQRFAADVLPAVHSFSHESVRLGGEE